MRKGSRSRGIRVATRRPVDPHPAVPMTVTAPARAVLATQTAGVQVTQAMGTAWDRAALMGVQVTQAMGATPGQAALTRATTTLRAKRAMTRLRANPAVRARAMGIAPHSRHSTVMDRREAAYLRSITTIPAQATAIPDRTVQTSRMTRGIRPRAAPSGGIRPMIIRRPRTIAR